MGVEIEKDGWKLVDENTFKPICVGEKRIDFRGDETIVSGGTPPHKPASSGFVNTDSGRFYAGVVGAKWVLTEPA